MTSFRVSAAILAVSIAIGGTLAYALVSDMADAHDESVSEPLRQLAALQSLINARPALEAELRRTQGRGATILGLVPGTSAPLAAANLEGEIKILIAAIGGEIRTSQSLPASQVSGFEQIQIAYDVTVPVNRIKDLMYRLETHVPYIFLDSVDIQAPQNMQIQSAVGPAPRLDIHWVARAYRWPSK